MTKRVVAGLLWSYLAWYAWSMYAGFQGWNPLWGAVIALSAIVAVLAVRVSRDWANRDPAGTAPLEPRQSPEPA